MSEEIKYVAGFMFDLDCKNVALIQKNRPDWQKGKLNGIGGKIEEGESAIDAMCREFAEETGVVCFPDEWTMFAVLNDMRGYKVGFFYSLGFLSEIRHVEDELPVICSVDGLPENVIPNLTWLIPMALTIATRKDNANQFTVTESV